MLRDKFSITLKRIDTIYRFVKDASSIANDVTAKQGLHVVNAKSLMGILSLDLTKRVEITVYGKIELSELYKLRQYISEE